MDDINKLNITGGDVLAYKPVPTMSKEVNSLHVEDPVEFTEIAEVGEPLDHYSRPLILMSESLPSGVISNLEMGLADINGYMDTIEKRISHTKVGDISFSDYKSALLDGDNDTVNLFMDYNFNDINGDTNVEIYHNLYGLRKEALEFNDVFATVVYGNNKITSEDATDTDNVRMDKLLELENTDCFNRINYAALNSDIQINKVSVAFASTLKSCANNLFMLSLQSPHDEIRDSKGHIYGTISKAFDNASIKSSQDRAKANLGINTKMVNNGLVNTVNSRTELLNALHAKHKLQDLPNVSDFMGTIVKATSDAESKALNRIVDFNKSVLLSSLNKDDNISSLKEKSDLRNIFRSIK